MHYLKCIYELKNCQNWFTEFYISLIIPLINSTWWSNLEILTSLAAQFLITCPVTPRTFEVDLV